METRNNKILGVSLSLVAFSFGFASQAYAQTCKVHPTCESLGYVNTVKQCKDGEMVKCPFDASKVFCRKVTVPKTKVCDTIGDILLDDKTCVAAADGDNIASDRTPIGVVFDVDRKLAIALEESSGELEFATNTIDIPGLTNYSSSSEAKGDYNGKNNTTIIITHGDSNGYETPAADYAYNYVTTGTNKGDWYLPAVGEFNLIYNNKTTLNNSLSKVGGTQFSKTTDYHYWSSSEYNRGEAWYMYYYNNNMGFATKNKNCYVRPILAFGASCTPNACSGYTLSSCPANGSCSSCDIVNTDCSDGGTKYKLDSCESGYKVSGNECVPDKKTYQCSFDGYSYWLTNGPYWIAQNGQIGVDAECECYCIEFPVYVRLERITSSYVYDSFEQGMSTPDEETQRNSEVTYNCGLMCDRTVTEDDAFNYIN